MYQHLKPNGLIITRLFGDELNWPNMNNMTLLKKEQIKTITQNFKAIYYSEEKQQKKGIFEHAFNLILEKQ